MPTTLPSKTYRTSGAVSSLERCLLAAYFVSLSAFCGLLIVNGPQIRAVAEAQEARIVEEEDRAFCGKFGVGPDTGSYAECAADLRKIRTRYLERSVGESIL